MAKPTPKGKPDEQVAPRRKGEKALGRDWYKPGTSFGKKAHAVACGNLSHPE